MTDDRARHTVRSHDPQVEPEFPQPEPDDAPHAPGTKTCRNCGRKIVRGLAGTFAQSPDGDVIRLNGTVCRVCLVEDGYRPSATTI